MYLAHWNYDQTLKRNVRRHHILIKKDITKEFPGLRMTPNKETPTTRENE